MTRAVALVFGAALLAVAASAASAAEADGLAECGAAELRLYLALAEASERAYDDTRPGLEGTPSGCVARITEDGDGNLVIAFRGSMLGDRKPKHRFSNLGGAVIRRNYRDWVATNLKQAAGFLPRQYTEAAGLVEKRLRSHPVDKLVYVTGHSKGGGAAAYAFVAAGLSPEVSPAQAARMRCVTFNAVVVRERNWRRLFRSSGPAAARGGKEPAAASILAIFMTGDPVSRIALSEERPYVKRIGIASPAGLDPNEQHAIRVIIDELRKRSPIPPENPLPAAGRHPGSRTVGAANRERPKPRGGAAPVLYRSRPEVVIPSAVRGHGMPMGNECGIGQPPSPVFTISGRTRYIKAAGCMRRPLIDDGRKGRRARRRDESVAASARPRRSRCLAGGLSV